MKTRIISLTLTLIMCAVLTLSLCACDKPQPSATADDPLWKNATYTEDTTLGSGEKTIKVKVEAGSKAITITLNTDADNLEDALTGAKLIEGEESEFGLYIKKVNGILADFDVDSTYWGIFKDGEYVMTGAKDTKITSGDQYELVRTK